MAERDRLVEALSTIDQQIGSARRDLQVKGRGGLSKADPCRPRSGFEMPVQRQTGCYNQTAAADLRRGLGCCGMGIAVRRALTGCCCPQVLARTDEQELCESRLIILQASADLVVLEHRHVADCLEHPNIIPATGVTSLSTCFGQIHIQGHIHVLLQRMSR